MSRSGTLALLVFSSCTAAEAMAQQAPVSPVSAPRVEERVSVTATRSPAAVGETAKTVYLLDSRALHQYPAVTLDEALRQHAGFELFRRSSGRVQNPTSQGVSLRGLGSTAASRTLVLENGAPLNDPFGGWVHWNENPTQTIEAVTLVSGGGSDLYGSSALGGVIDVVPGEPEATRVELSGSGGSQETADYQGLVSGNSKANHAMLVGEVLRSAGYVQLAPGLLGAVDTRSNVHSEAFRTELAHGFRDGSSAFLTGNVLNEARGNGTVLQNNGTRLWRYLGGYRTPEDRRVTGRVRVFGADEAYRQSFTSIAADRSSEAVTRLQKVEAQEVGATGDATVKFGPFAVVGGADVRDLRALDHENPQARGAANGLQDTSARQRFIGGFGEILGAKGRWSGAASLRADRSSNLDVLQFVKTLTGPVTTTRPADRTEIVLSPRVGLVRGFDRGLSLHATGFRAFRTPTMNELYRNGQVGQELTLANATLESERATGWEVGGEAARLPGASRLTATYFWTEINRPVSAVLVSQTATAVTNKRQNLGQIRSQGVELGLQIRPEKRVSGSLGYQFAAATVTKFSAQPALVGNWIPDVPRESVTGQVRVRSERLGAFTLAARGAGRVYDNSGNTLVLAKFFQLDLSGERRIGRRAEVFFTAENLTDRRQEVGRTPLLTLGTPIFAMAGLRFRVGGVAP